ncbi:hypothetical protein GCM10023318_52740 [Nocardia callitridis]|uniref:Uncharacterized protein n=1 Tax=Nocardia callitridis TaxID=648753 RepID=A0ABP9KX60_9NOCA
MWRPTVRAVASVRPRADQKWSIVWTNQGHYLYARLRLLDMIRTIAAALSFAALAVTGAGWADNVHAEPVEVRDILRADPTPRERRRRWPRSATSPA